MATKKASPAQLAARKKFVEMVRSGAFKKRKNNPMHKYTVLHRGTANIAGEVMASGPQAAKQKVAEKLGIPTLAYLIAKKTNPAKKTVSQKISQLTHEGYPQKQAIAVALSEQHAGKVKKNPTKQRSSGQSAVMQNPVKNKSSYTVYCQAPGQSIHSWTKLATFYSATGAKQYANAYAKMYKSHYVRVEPW